MNSPFQKRRLLPFYRSQVIDQNQYKLSLDEKEGENNKKQSFMPDTRKKHEEFKKKQFDCDSDRQKRLSFNQQKNIVKGCEHLLSPKSKRTLKSPQLNYRMKDNLSPKTCRQNFYISENQTGFQENRSIKFISKLREEISSPKNLYRQSKSTKKNEKIMPQYKKQTNQKYDSPFTESLKKKNIPQEIQSINQNIWIKSEDQASEQSFSQSHERQTFEKKLVYKCKQLKEQLQNSKKEILKLKAKFHSLQQKYNSELNSLKNRHTQQITRKETQNQMLKSQLTELGKQIKSLEKSKISKQKVLQQQISKYIRQLKQSQMEKNKLVFQFQQALKQSVQTKERIISQKFNQQIFKLSQQNRTLKSQLKEMRKNISQVQQEKMDIFQEGNLLNVELKNYTKWNFEISQKNRFFQKKIGQLENLNKKFKKETQSLHHRVQSFEQITKNYESQVNKMQITKQKISQQIQFFRFENQSLKNELESRLKQIQRDRSSLMQKIQFLEAQCMTFNKEKHQLLEEADYLRKELFNMRSLTRSLQDSLEEKIIEMKDLTTQKIRYSQDLRQKCQKIKILMSQMIHKKSQIQKMSFQIQQLKNIIKSQSIQSQQSYKLTQKVSLSEQRFDKQAKNELEKKSISECLLKINQLQMQLSDLIIKYKKQKSDLVKKHLNEKQQFNKKIIGLEKQLLRKEQSFMKQKKHLSHHLVRIQSQNTNLEQQILIKNKQNNQCFQELTMKEIEYQHLEKKFQDLEGQFSQRQKNMRLQLEKARLNQERQKNHYKETIKKLIQKVLKQIETSLKKKDKEIYFSSQKGDESGFNSQQKMKFFNLGLSNQKDCQQLEFNAVSRVREIISQIQLMTKKIDFYEMAFAQLQFRIESQSIAIYRQNLSKISQLQKKLFEHQDRKNKEMEEFQKYESQQKRKLYKQMNKINKQKLDIQKQLTSLQDQIRSNKKIIRKMQLDAQSKEQQHRNSIKQLSSKLQEYQNVIKTFQSKQIYQKVHHQQKLSINHQQEQECNQKYSFTSPSKIQSQQSLQQILQQRIRELNVFNQNLSQQFKRSNDQLLALQQTLNNASILKENLEKKVQKIRFQNCMLRSSLNKQQLQEQEREQKINSLRLQNMKLHQQRSKKDEVLNVTLQQLKILRKSYQQISKKKLYLQIELQKSSKSEARALHDIKNFEDQMKIKENQLKEVGVKFQYESQNNLRKIQQVQQQLKEQENKRKQLEKVHKQLLKGIKDFSSFGPQRQYIFDQSKEKSDNFEFQNEYQKETIIQLTSGFNSKIKSLNHKVQQYEGFIKTLRLQNHRKQQLLRNFQQQIKQKQTQILAQEKQIKALRNKTELLEIDIQEWKFICESNSLNKSIHLNIDKQNLSLIPHQQYSIKQEIQQNQQQTAAILPLKDDKTFHNMNQGNHFSYHQGKDRTNSKTTQIQ